MAGDARILAAQVGYANRTFLRNPLAAFFTLVFPLSFLVILSAVFGNAVVNPATGMRLAQYTTPAFAVYAAATACYVSLGSALAYARGNGVLKRLRGTPLPPRLHILGRIVSATLIAAVAVGIMVGVGVLFYGVEIIGANVPALLLTFVVGAASFAALGFAVAAVAPTPNAATAFTNVTLITLGFVSGIFALGDLPSWMERLGSFFPLKPFVEAFADGFDPALDAAAPAWSKLAVIAAWGTGGALIAWRSLSWEPSAAALARLRRRTGAPEASVEPAVSRESLQTVRQPGPPGAMALLGSQLRYGVRQILRDPMATFFGIAFPIVLLVFFAGVNGRDAQFAGMRLAQYMAASFAVYGVATTAMVNLPSAIAADRGNRVLKRLRGTPLPPWGYLAGRLLASLLLGLVTVVLVFAVGAIFFDVALPPGRWPISLLTLLIIIGSLAACGMAIVSLVDGQQAVTAAGLLVLLPLSFISEIFLLGADFPELLNGISWFFPLRHAVNAAVTATSGGALDTTFWGHLAVLGLWLLAASLVAWRLFRWEPRRA